MPLPKVSADTILSTTACLHGEDREWVFDNFEELYDENPEFISLVAEASKRFSSEFGEPAGDKFLRLTMGFYRLLRRQAESDEMNQTLGLPGNAP